jgi:glycosyltransferase involved in cell wall biosynthesis
MICYELVKELSRRKVPLTYIMPLGPDNAHSEFANLIIAEKHSLGKNIKSDIISVPGAFMPYQSPEDYEKDYELKLLRRKSNITKEDLYGPNLPIEIDLYAKRVYNIVKELDFDLIHAHDWLTYPAAIGIADKTGKPLIVHIHNTIYDRYLGNSSKWERDIEYNGLKRADVIIAISHYVKNMIINKYDINPDKIKVIHHGKNTLIGNLKDIPGPNFKNKKVVLFTGRVTIQKGIEYLIMAAKKVLEKRKDVVFVIMGGGDPPYLRKMIDLAAKLGISKDVLFNGKPYTLEEGKSLYKIADCYVMPSVSEPFGIVPMEAMKYGTPSIVSKQSGVSEVIKNAFKVDFWDTTEMASKILNLLSYKVLHKQMKEEGMKEIESMTWEKPVNQLINAYNESLKKHTQPR